MTVIPIMIGVLGTVPQKSERMSGRAGNRWTNRDYPDYSIVKIEQEYSEESKSPEETCYHSDSSEMTPDNAGVKNSKK